MIPAAQSGSCAYTATRSIADSFLSFSFALILLLLFSLPEFTTGAFGVEAHLASGISNTVFLSAETIPGERYLLRSAEDLIGLQGPLSSRDIIFSGDQPCHQIFSATNLSQFFQVLSPGMPVISGEWPGYQRANAYGLEVHMPYVFVASSYAGLQILEVQSSGE